MTILWIHIFLLRVKGEGGEREREKGSYCALSFFTQVCLKINCIEIMELFIYYKNLINVHFCWPFFYYLPLWYCIEFAWGITQLPSDKRAVDTDSFVHYETSYGHLATTCKKKERRSLNKRLLYIVIWYWQ